MTEVAVIGLGGAGGNITNNIIANNWLQNVDFILADSDAQALSHTAGHTIQLGADITKGLGAGANLEIGKRAAQASLSKVMEAIAPYSTVFL